MVEEIRRLPTGKKPARHDPRTLDFGKYLADRVVIDGQTFDTSGPPPVAASSLGHASLMPTPRLMLSNGPDPSNQAKYPRIAPYGVGCCVYSGLGNKHRLSWAISKRGLFPTDGPTTIVNYEITGFDPSQTDSEGNNPTDQGTDMLTAMTQQLKSSTAYVDAKGTRHTFGAFAKVSLSNPNHLLWAIYLDDSGVLVGQLLGNTQMQEFGENKAWTQGDEQDGHCTLLDRELYMETWGRDQPCTKGYIFGSGSSKANLDEAYFVVDNEGLVNGKSIEGFDSQQLMSDGKSLSAA